MNSQSHRAAALHAVSRNVQRKPSRTDIIPAPRNEIVKEEYLSDDYASGTDLQYPDQGDEMDEDEDVGAMSENESEGDPYALSEDQYSEDSDGTVDEICPEVQEEIDEFMASFRKLDLHYKIVSKTGEGTFSSVYKAIDLRYDKYINEWDLDERTAEYYSPRSKRQRLNPREKKVKYVAIKKIYVTSSPQRIHNELELLKDLTGSKNVVSLITAFRHLDQVIAVMPYFRHVDFRDYFRKLSIPEIQLYMRSLFTALKFVHAKDILHRDIKPTNFLYDCAKGRGVLVDFGLAEREEHDGVCPCTRARGAPPKPTAPVRGYPKNDQRPSKRANRAGTRGFRAPEVLFKCNRQTTKIDVWSAGVILLTFLSKRFPFFNSPDDIDAIIEMATVFGRVKMRACATLHGATFETGIPTISEKGHSLSSIVEWATSRPKPEAGRRGDSLSTEEKRALDFLEKTLDLDHRKRLSAAEALNDPFLTNIGTDISDDEVETI
ncbi:hypothetical protein TWF481_004285 [Arthrobotrys musiformis]|uniref:non-specific serine/threonine protein kinase n=1 Tax=Arthrobotrys musiformis TaxID=47236 RepID=A0AAV9WJ39_9PEZI